MDGLMNTLVLEWLNLAFRWFHVVAAIAWIGASFYFIWLDLSLRTPPQWKTDQGVKGDLWAIHGGGIYELLLRTPLVKRGLVIVVALLAIISLASYIAHQLFSARAAYLHVGAMIATWMAGNVFWGIMPAQRKFIAAVSNNEAPNACAMAFAKLRSTHNNYLTLPVIFCMLSNHYSFLYGHAYSWLVLVGIGVCLAWGRHFFNLKHLGYVKPIILVTSFLGIVVIALLMSLTSGSPSASNFTSTNSVASDSASLEGDVTPKAAQTTSIDVAKITQLVQVHCTNCHSATPSQPGFSAAPAGLIIDSAAQLAAQKIRALPALYSGYMPLGNFHQMTELERKTIIDWLNAQ